MLVLCKRCRLTHNVLSMCGTVSCATGLAPSVCVRARQMCVGRVAGRWPIVREVICGRRVRPGGPGVREFLTQVMTLMPPVWSCAAGRFRHLGGTRCVTRLAIHSHQQCGQQMICVVVQDGPTHPSEVMHLCQTQGGTF